MTVSGRCREARGLLASGVKAAALALLLAVTLFCTPSLARSREGAAPPSSDTPDGRFGPYFFFLAAFFFAIVFTSFRHRERG